MIRACDRAGKETRREVRATLREAGDVVKEDWQARMRSIDERSAAGLRTVVRVRGVSVEQSLRKTTGKHPEYGALQMRRGIHAVDAKRDQAERAMERAIDKVADHFGKG